MRPYSISTSSFVHTFGMIWHHHHTYLPARPHLIDLGPCLVSMTFRVGALKFRKTSLHRAENSDFEVMGFGTHNVRSDHDYKGLFLSNGAKAQETHAMLKGMQPAKVRSLDQSLILSNRLSDPLSVSSDAPYNTGLGWGCVRLRVSKSFVSGGLLHGLAPKTMSAWRVSGSARFVDSVLGTSC